jgi:hypothetical protein
VFPVTVGVGLSAELHVLVPDPFGYLDETIPENLATKLESVFPGGRLSVVLAERDGFAVANPVRSEDASRVAAAIGVMRARCSWDESDPIEVVVSGASIKVSVAYLVNNWFAWPGATDVPSP